MGIQISGLLSGQAFDWKSVVDQLIQVDSIPITNLQNEKSTNTDKIAAYGDIYTSLGALQDSLQSIRSAAPFTDRAVNSSDTTTTWRSTSSAGAPLGSYAFEVQTLATAAHLDGGTGLVKPLSDPSFSTLTMGSLPIASAVTPGTFTVDGQQISFTSDETLQTVLDRIATTTGDVSWTYNANDTISLTRASGNLTLGAANDTSNFLQALKLSNPSGSTATSSGPLATVQTSATLANARLKNAITAVDASGNGAFYVNNVKIAYNVNTDSLSSVMDRITQSGAKVKATYDSANDKVVLTNSVTGDIGLSVSEAAGGFLDAFNITSGGTTTVNALSRGTNAVYRVNGGSWITSASNTLDSTSHGITGLSVTVNTTGTQTLTVAADTSSMTTSIQDFIDKFNALQDVIDSKTKITTSGGTTSASLLSSDHEIQTWARQLQQMAFNVVPNVTGSITHLDDLGIDFDGTTGHLTIKDSAKLNNALANKPEDVQSYFSANGEGQVPQMYGLLTTFMTADLSQQDTIRTASQKIDDQVTTLQTRLDNERQQLTQSFIAMLDAQSAAQSQNAALTNTFFKNSSG